MKNLIKGAVVMFAVLFTAQLANAQQKLGHVNFNELFSLAPETKVAQDQLKTLSDTKTKEIQDMYGLYQTKQTEANDKLRNRSEANKESVDAEIQKLGNELRDMETRITESQRIAQEELNKREEELLAPVHKKVSDTISAIAKEKGFAYVFDISTGSIPYFQGGEDITAAVKAKLGIK